MLKLLVGLLCSFQLVSSLEATGITASCLEAYLKKEPTAPFGSAANGWPAKLKEFPHLTSIGWRNEDKISWGCGGSLVTRKFVLTAAHCSYRFQRGKRVPPNVARMGAVELELDSLRPFELAQTNVRDKEETAQQFEIVKVVPHPQYSSKERYHDIALVELDREVELTEFVVPICLWNDEKEVFTDLQAAGFGEVEFASGVSPTLNKITLTRTGIDECRGFYGSGVDKKLPRGLVEEQHICASDKTNREMDTCQGDSGGPLEYRMLSKTANSRWASIPVLLGLTSFGQAGCGTSAPAVYTRVSSYLDWIEKETKESLDLQKCASQYEIYREKLTTNFDGMDVPSKVTVGDCTGIIIHQNFVLSAPECVKPPAPSSVRTLDNQTVEIAEIHQNGKLALLQLKTSIKYTARTNEELQDEFTDGNYPYLYRVGPSCIQPDVIDPEYPVRPYRTLEGALRSDPFKFEQVSYNVSECLLYLDVEETLDETQYECLGGKWFVPGVCSIAPSSFTSQESYGDSEVYHQPIPLVKGFVERHSSCGAVLAKKITEDDIKWMDSIIFKQ